MAKALKIKAKKDGYRRAGYGFSDTKETTLLLDDLKKEQVEALRADKNLLVTETDVGTDEASKPGAKGGESKGEDKDKADDKKPKSPPAPPPAKTPQGGDGKK